jgi:hypothetical protein
MIYYRHDDGVFQDAPAIPRRRRRISAVRESFGRPLYPGRVTETARHERGVVVAP